MTNETRVLIADDHEVLRRGLRQVMEEAGLNVLAEAADGASALRLIQELRPDAALLDVKMPEMTGFDVARQVLRLRLAVPIILLAGDPSEKQFDAAMDLGVKGYVLKENAVTDIVASVRSVTAGRPYISPSFSGRLLNRSRKADRLAGEYPALKDLSPVDRRILQLMSHGKTSKEISEELCISSRTIDNHRTNVAQRLGLSGPHALLKFAIEHKSELA